MDENKEKNDLCRTSVRRRLVLAEVVGLISEMKVAHPLRVAIDGVDAAGKTTIANELALCLQKLGRIVIRAGIDGFHNPKGKRYMQADVAAGYYEDSFNYDALKNELLIPLGPGGNLIYRTSVFDYQRDESIYMEAMTAASDSILLFDGVFLLRKELIEYWDCRIFIDINFHTQLKRVQIRDRGLFGTPKMIKERYRKRYIPGQKLYLRTEQPKGKAMIIIRNDDEEGFWPSGRGD